MKNQRDRAYTRVNWLVNYYKIFNCQFSQILAYLKFCLVDLFSYITREELRQALSEYQMGDEAAIDEVIDDVDTDNVCYKVYILYY